MLVLVSEAFQCLFKLLYLMEEKTRGFHGRVVLTIPTTYRLGFLYFSRKLRTLVALAGKKKFGQRVVGRKA